MSAATVYEGEMSNGIKYRVHQSDSFSNKCDIAISIENKYIAVLTIAPKRSGSIDVIPMTIGRQTIVLLNKEKPVVKATTTEEPTTDLLSDVITNPETLKTNSEEV